MARSLAVLLAAMVGACTAPPSASAVPTAAAAGAGATLTVSGSGFVCGPWYFGCGAVLTVASPGSTAPLNWAPGDDDTWFKVDHVAGGDGPAPVTGVEAHGQDRIDPGRYQLIVVMTQQSDVGGSTMSPSFGCSAALDVPAGTLAVHVDVRFRVDPPPCAIVLSVEGPSQAPSPPD